MKSIPAFRRGDPPRYIIPDQTSERMRRSTIDSNSLWRLRPISEFRRILKWKDTGGKWRSSRETMWLEEASRLLEQEISDPVVFNVNDGSEKKVKARPGMKCGGYITCTKHGDRETIEDASRKSKYETSSTGCGTCIKHSGWRASTQHGRVCGWKSRPDYRNLVFKFDLGFVTKRLLLGHLVAWVILRLLGYSRRNVFCRIARRWPNLSVGILKALLD